MDQKMKIYLVIVNDSTSGVTIDAYRDEAEAISAAKKQAKEYAIWNDSVVIDTRIEGWLYHAEYTQESYVYVEEVELK